MNFSKAFVWRFGIASTALLAAVSVYTLARIYPPELLAPFKATQALFTDQTGLLESAPSFLYTLAVGLIIGACASAQANARMHCLIWLGLALLLEIAQHPVISEPLASWLSETLSVSVWEIIGPYWHRGTFDPQDLIATAAGGIIALIILTHAPGETKHAQG